MIQDLNLRVFTMKDISSWFSVPNLRNIIVMLEVVPLDVWKIQHAASIKRDRLIEPVYEPN
jgi:hypothetical protein